MILKLRFSVLSMAICILSLQASAQLDHFELSWQPSSTGVQDETPYTLLDKPLSCFPCIDKVEASSILPVFVHRVKLTADQKVSEARLRNVKTALHSDISYKTEISSRFEQEIIHYTTGQDHFAVIKLTAIKQASNGVQTLESFDLELVYTQNATTSGRISYKKDQTYTSVLSSGEIYKISVPSKGVYKITLDFLQQNGINTSGKKLSEFKIFGNGGAMLPEIIAENRPEDLKEIPLWVLDQNSNDLFDANDLVLWYASGPDSIAYNPGSKEYTYSKNDFEDLAYYFIKWSSGTGKRMQTGADGSGLSVDLSLDQYDYYIHHENDEINFIHSGRMWWGDEMSTQTTRSFSHKVEGALIGEDLTIESRTAARSLSSSNNRISVSIDGNNVLVFNYLNVTGEFDRAYTDAPRTLKGTNTIVDTDIDVLYSYSKPHPDAAAWIDYYNLVVPRALKVFNQQQSFFNKDGAINGNVKYQISSLNTAYRVLNVTDIHNVEFQPTFVDGSYHSFTKTASSSTLDRFLIVDPSSAFNPGFVDKIENQNYHGLSDIEYLIITHPSFLVDAEKLADFHRNYSGLTVEVINVKKLYNEFSSGSEDITAIRDFVKLIYDRGQAGSKELQFLLLFGDASYDFKNRLELNTNFVPIYQSFDSYVPASSHCSDDYYAILGDNEGYWGIEAKFEGVDIGVGRLPASTADEAQLLVDKVLHYHSATSLGPWTQKISFLADDQDNNYHVNDGEKLTDTYLSQQNPELNINKIWLDAYEQISFGSGNKYPEVNVDVDKSINQGSLIFHYIGHGGHSGMAHERVVTRPMISSWTNYDRLSFFITASCELAAFDNPSQKSPGELMLLNTTGGAVGLIATTRVVFFQVNQGTNATIINNNLFEPDGSSYKPLGTIYKDTRNRIGAGAGVNSRSFMLLADPAMRLHHPKHEVVTTKVNGTEFSSFSDTLKALSKVTIEGEIRNDVGQLQSNFNGTLYPTFYDKFANYETRGNDPNSPIFTFKLQNNVIYKGQISVINGKFQFSFVVPKDISYQFGDGKMSYYASAGLEQAGGYNQILVGGTTDSLQNDQDPPELGLFIDDRSWVFGGLTNNTPLLLADIYDENGINTVGSGIGREMEAILDKGTEEEQSIILNEFFQPELNSYQAGQIEYRFGDLAVGKHTIHLKVWDAYNNATEAYTEFTVAQDEALSIDNLLNYPNPFNKFTTFHFDHNRAGQNLVANITIYSVSGKVVKSMTIGIPNANTHSSDLSWDGLDEYGDPLARGVYLYTLELKAEDGSTEKRTEKLYIIN